MELFDLIVIPFLYLEYFVQKFLCGIYYTSQNISYWNFNRTLDRRNQELYNKTFKPNEVKLND